MINEIIFMNGYGLYVWSSFIFTLSSFFFLYFIIKFQLTKEQKKFGKKLEICLLKKLNWQKNKKHTENYWQIHLFTRFNYFLSCMVRKLN